MVNSRFKHEFELKFFCKVVFRALASVLWFLEANGVSSATIKYSGPNDAYTKPVSLAIADNVTLPMAVSGKRRFDLAFQYHIL